MDTDSHILYMLILLRDFKSAIKHNSWSRCAPLLQRLLVFYLIVILPEI